MAEQSSESVRVVYRVEIASGTREWRQGEWDDNQVMFDSYNSGDHTFGDLEEAKMFIEVSRERYFADAYRIVKLTIVNEGVVQTWEPFRS